MSRITKAAAASVAAILLASAGSAAGAVTPKASAAPTSAQAVSYPTAGATYRQVHAKVSNGSSYAWTTNPHSTISAAATLTPKPAYSWSVMGAKAPVAQRAAAPMQAPAAATAQQAAAARTVALPGGMVATAPAGVQVSTNQWGASFTTADGLVSGAVNVGVGGGGSLVGGAGTVYQGTPTVIPMPNVQGKIVTEGAWFPNRPNAVNVQLDYMGGDRAGGTANVVLPVNHKPTPAEITSMVKQFLASQDGKNVVSFYSSVRPAR
ncbi:hypothetical protein [Arthrobacter sp. UM1]|uniref:hypothetical protein n=1 Tax=Arthrobacter sp. UM1 TaxID=2766776 RepID=UPI001CF6D08B|nr:hypothetical protein [Arthrobacter sp. UM1]MCB4208772.1 hypothetical protein [Arthrobacter sp. UM1]